jgi:hypothetical protein
MIWEVARTKTDTAGAPMKKDKGDGESSNDMGSGSNKTVTAGLLKKDKDGADSSNDDIGGGSNKTVTAGAPMKVVTRVMAESSNDTGSGSNKTVTAGAPLKKDKGDAESSNDMGSGSNKTVTAGAPMKKDKDDSESSSGKPSNATSIEGESSKKGNGESKDDSGRANPCDAVICETATRKCVISPQELPCVLPLAVVAPCLRKLSSHCGGIASTRTLTAITFSYAPGVMAWLLRMARNAPRKRKYASLVPRHARRLDHTQSNVANAWTANGLVVHATVRPPLMIRLTNVLSYM